MFPSISVNSCDNNGMGKEIVSIDYLVGLFERGSVEFVWI
jgi:hypothetical protein